MSCPQLHCLCSLFCPVQSPIEIHFLPFHLWSQWFLNKIIENNWHARLKRPKPNLLSWMLFSSFFFFHSTCFNGWQRKRGKKMKDHSDSAEIDMKWRSVNDKPESLIRIFTKHFLKAAPSDDDPLNINDTNQSNSEPVQHNQSPWLWLFFPRMCCFCAFPWKTAFCGH